MKACQQYVLKNFSSDFPRAMHVWALHFLAQSARLGIKLVLQNQANNNTFLPSFRWRVEISSKLVLFRVRPTSTRWLHVWISDSIFDKTSNPMIPCETFRDAHAWSTREKFEMCSRRWQIYFSHSPTPAVK